MRTKSRPLPSRAPADFDEVKRRFVRQNRELARNNSNQGLRIRSLELEVSRLLDENLALRSEISKLGSEVFAAKNSATVAAVKKIKGELAAKLAEISGLVEGIDEESHEVDERRIGSFEPREWRQRQPLSELMADSQMPTIEEDKSFPRQTLDTDQIKATRLSEHSSNESPDLGPPPVAHFDVEGDPIKFDARRQPSDVGEEELPASLSVNLETRKKRKDGQPKPEIRRSSILPQSPNKNANNEPAPTLRTGAKRKLADREPEKATKPQSQGDFTFSRKGATEENKPISEKAVTQEEGKPIVATPASPVSKPSRKVLGDKSVNQSPRKAPAAATGKSSKDDLKKPATQNKDSAKAARPHGRKPRVSSIPAPSPSPPANRILPTVEFPPPTEEATASEHHPPKTPAAEQVFSPTPSEPSTRPTQHEQRGDTPPPGDLSTFSNSTTATNEGARPSRRARSAVNYAEPSLNTKMRRPDKKMVDALSGLHDKNRKSSVTLVTEKKVDSCGEDGFKTSEAVVVKEEPVDEEDDAAWKELPPSDNATAPTSPCGQKAAEIDANNPTPSEEDSSKVVRKRRQSSQLPLSTVTSTPDTDLAEKMRELEVYDFKDTSSSSSPAGTEDSQAVRPVVKARTTAAQRRHSSVPSRPCKEIGGVKGSDFDTQTAKAADKEAVSSSSSSTTTTTANAAGGRSERAASRRRSMML
ncbi:hypothetical protein MBLNU230_g6310t1 [Neophaeotheca triangularis]